MNLSTALTFIVSAMSAADRAAATYTLVGGIDTGVCADSGTRDYARVASFNIGQNETTASDKSYCVPFPGNSQALAYCSDYCKVFTPPSHVGLQVSRRDALCWGCDCLFDNYYLSDSEKALYDPPIINTYFANGTGPVTKSLDAFGFNITCYAYTPSNGSSKSAKKAKGGSAKSAKTNSAKRG